MTSPSYSRAQPNRIASEVGGNYRRKSLRGNPTYAMNRHVCAGESCYCKQPAKHRCPWFNETNERLGPNARPLQRIVAPEDVARMCMGRAASCETNRYKCSALTKNGVRYRCNGTILAVEQGRPQRCAECLGGTKR